MIRLLSSATALLVLSALPAAAAKVEWRGIAIVTAVSSGCGGDYSVGSAIPIRFRQAGLGDNGSSSSFAFHQTFYAQSFVVTGSFPKTWTQVNAGNLGAGWGPFVNTAQFKMTSIIPASFTATTQTLTFNGSITNFEDTAGCSVTFRAAATLKP